MRAWLVVVALLSASIAGCSEDPKADSAAIGEAATSTSTAPTGAAANAPPTASLTADALAGAIPLLVNFTIEGSDADGANLTWSVATNGTVVAEGTALPGAANHTFTQPGLWTVTLTVSDGNATAESMLEINATAASNATRASPAVIATYSQHGLIGGPYALTNDPVYAHQCPGFNAGQSGYGCVFLPFSAKGAHDGKPAILTTNAANFRLAFWDLCSPTSGKGVGFASGTTGGNFTIPAGAGCGVVWSSNTGDWGADRTFTITVYSELPKA